MSRRGKFYRLLEVSRPKSFPQHGKLSLRQIDRMLKRRRNLARGFLASPLSSLPAPNRNRRYDPLRREVCIFS
jgi:hypothetical protein